MKPKICLISDVRGWAFDQNNHDLAEYLEDSFDFSHFYVADMGKGLPNWNEYDAIFELYHRNPGLGLPYYKTAGALRSEWFYTEQPGLPSAGDIATVNRYAMFQVAVKRNYEELIDKCPNVVYLTNPVNMKRFPTSTPLRNAIVAEWNGNAAHKARHSFIKHFKDIIIPSCQTAGIKLNAAEYNTPQGEHRRRSREEMPYFYKQANVALCASEFEAASNSVLEGMASGLAVIATDVGNHREMRDSQLKEYGDTGIVLVERNIDSFVKALQDLTPERAYEMGQINRAEISERWSWTAWAPKYADFLQKTIQPGERKPAPRVLKAAITASPVDFSYWNKTNPDTFLADDWNNPSRDWVGRVVKGATEENNCRTLAEVGPGTGVDYEHQFKPSVLAGSLVYKGFEGSSGFCAYLKQKYPEVLWENKALTELPQQAFDIVYTRAVLEHQPALEPSLSWLLGAANKFVVLIWYRPPSDRPSSVYDRTDGVHYNTFKRDEVLSIASREGWHIVEEKSFDSGNLGWVLGRNV